MLLLGLAAAASAVIIDSGDGTGNVTAPVPDPGWSYVGTRGGLTVVYLGGSFVLTANHVGAGDVVLEGTPYTFVPGTAVQLHNTDMSLADLLMFQIHPQPPSLPPLPIWSDPDNSPPNGTELILIGHGRNRGPATSFDCGEGPSSGYEWGPGHAMRWGTNFVDDEAPLPVFNTEAFATFFNAAGSAHEAQAATGDSGGAAFAWTGTQWELAGILYAIGLCPDQPAATALYENSTYAANLFVYRDEIQGVIAMPEPSGGPWAGGLLVAALGAASRSPRRDRRAGASRVAASDSRAARSPAAQRWSR